MALQEQLPWNGEGKSLTEVHLKENELVIEKSEEGAIQFIS